MSRTLMALLFAAALAACCPSAEAKSSSITGDFRPAAKPTVLQVAWLDGHTLAEARKSGAVLLDRFPDAVIVTDEASANALRAAGFRVDAPVLIPAGRTVTLVRERDASASAADLDPRDFEKAGAQLVWRGGRNAIAIADGPLAEEAPWSGHARKVLRDTPLGVGPADATAPAKAAATDFPPAIQAMVDQVSGTTFMDWIRDMGNGRSTLVGGSPVTFNTRATPTTKCDQAEQWAYERLIALGYTDVQYDPYTFSTTSARNIVATLPGTESPNKIVVLGAHLDSTSPTSSTLAPGANDNASGVAGLLEIARILRGYSFKNTIRFVVFTGEEQGLYGSIHYANAAAARGDSIVGAVIFDMIGWHNLQNKIDIEGETAYLPLMNIMNDACARYTTLATNMVIGSWGSDHVPFQDAGYSAFLAIENEYPSYPCYHQTCDSVGWNQPTFGSQVMKAGLATVAQVAGVRDFFISHTPLPSTENTATPYEVVADISQLAPLVTDSLLLHWSTGGAWSTATLAATGTANRWHAYIPAQTHATVSYWLGAKDNAGRHAFHPTNAPATVHQFTVAARETLFTEGFETGASGWTHGGTIDDWQVATPAGLAEDPATAYAGTKIAGTDITGLGATPGKYENNCDTWFESPAVDCSLSTGVRLLFARKLAVEKSSNNTWDYARVLVNGTVVWESASGANTVDAAWAMQNIDISALADGKKSVKVRWTLHSDGTVNFGGWNIDEVRLTGMSTASPVLDAGPATGRAGLVLHASIPNPARASTLLRFELPRASRTELAVFDVRGRRVRTLVDGSLEAGLHEARWDGLDSAGKPQAAGVYFYRISSPEGAVTRKLTLVH